VSVRALYREYESRSAGPAHRRIFARLATASDQRGFTLVEMTTSVAVLLIVLTAAWLLLTASNSNLNTIDYGGQSSELNRAALAWFERDLNHAVLPADDVSPVLDAEGRHCTILVDTDNDGSHELVTWEADLQHNSLIRVLTQSPNATDTPVAISDFSGGATTTTTVVTGLDWQDVPAMFAYLPNAKDPWDGDVRKIGLITFHLRNGLPNATTNVTDRTAAFRVISYVINGY